LPRLQRWRGVALVAAVAAVTVWLAASGQLVLYIHPRYIVFTVAMAVAALLLAVAAAIVVPRDDAPERPTRIGVVALGVSALFVLGVVALPPATLSAETAAQRDIAGGIAGTPAQSVDDAAGASAETFSNFTVVDWASLLRQTADPAFYDGKPVDVVGFVVPDPDAPDLFYVSRFVVTCCAVDAQPTGVPVYLPGWQDRFETDAWVQVTGEFASNPSPASAHPLAVAPQDVVTVEQPDEPYLF